MDRGIDELNRFSSQLYKKFWNLELDIPIVINSRMSKNSARYMKEYIYSDGVRIGIKGVRIELSRFSVDNYTDEGLADLIKHELCHHACLSQNKPYTDGANYFESELERIGASSHSSTHEELVMRGYVVRR